MVWQLQNVFCLTLFLSYTTLLFCFIFLTTKWALIKTFYSNHIIFSRLIDKEWEIHYSLRNCLLCCDMLMFYQNKKHCFWSFYSRDLQMLFLWQNGTSYYENKDTPIEAYHKLRGFWEYLWISNGRKHPTQPPP